MDHTTRSPADYEASWLKFQRRRAGDANYDEHDWVVDGWVFWPEQRPRDLWDAIVGISKLELTEMEAVQLGTGPLESLLNERFAQFAPLALLEATKRTSFAIALRHVIPPDEFDDEFEHMLIQLNSRET